MATSQFSHRHTMRTSIRRAILMVAIISQSISFFPQRHAVIRQTTNHFIATLLAVYFLLSVLKSFRISVCNYCLVMFDMVCVETLLVLLM